LSVTISRLLLGFRCFPHLTGYGSEPPLSRLRSSILRPFFYVPVHRFSSFSPTPMVSSSHRRCPFSQCKQSLAQREERYFLFPQNLDSTPPDSVSRTVTLCVDLNKMTHKYLICIPQIALWIFLSCFGACRFPPPRSLLLRYRSHSFFKEEITKSPGAHCCVPRYRPQTFSLPLSLSYALVPFPPFSHESVSPSFSGPVVSAMRPLFHRRAHPLRCTYLPRFFLFT